MKKMTKFLSLLLILTMAISLFTGCGKKETTEEVVAPGTTETTATTTEATTTDTTATDTDTTEAAPTLVPEDGATLVVWESDGPEKTFVEYAIAEFNKLYPNVTIEYQPVGHTDSTAKIALDGPNGEGADVFAAPHDKLGELVASSLVLENDQLDATQYLDAAVTGATYEGKFYGYPTGIETYALFYNKDIVSTPATTFDEIITFAKTFNDPATNKFALMWDVGNAYFSYIFLGGFDADLFGPKGDDKTTLGFDTQAGIDGMKYYQSVKSIYDVAAADANYDAMMASFKAGNAAYMINGPWAIKDCKDAGINFGVVELPKFPNGNNPKSFSGIRGNYVSSYTKYPNAAKLFAAFMSSKDVLAKRYEITSQIPPMKDITVSDEYNAGILAQAAYAVPMPNIPAMAQFWPAMGGAFANIWNGGDVQAELDAAAKAMKEAIK